MKFYFFIPSLRRVSGGVIVLYRLAYFFKQAGYEVYAVHRGARGWRPWWAKDILSVVWDRVKLHKKDFWIVPEGWFNALLPGLQSNAKTIVYCQNWAYLFSALPSNCKWQDLDVDFWAVSQPVAWFIEHTLGIKTPILRPGIDLNLFNFNFKKNQKEINICYMPRKNSALARQIIQIFNQIIQKKGISHKINFLKIENLSQEDVAKVFAKAHIFLNTGFPEGCPLPPLEAMASGCLVVGFTGFGGWDYMRQIIPDKYIPSFPLRSVAWQGNGFFSADGDVMDVVLNLELAVQWILEKDQKVNKVLENAYKTACAYSLDIQKESFLNFIKKLISNDSV